MSDNFPTNMSFHVEDKVEKPFSKQIIKKLVANNYNGHIKMDGSILQLPPGFNVKRISVGYYALYHSLGKPSYSFSCNILDKQGHIDILLMNDTKIEIKILNQNKEYMDADFVFSLCLTG